MKKSYSNLSACLAPDDIIDLARPPPGQSVVQDVLVGLGAPPHLDTSLSDAAQHVTMKPPTKLRNGLGRNELFLGLS